LNQIGILIRALGMKPRSPPEKEPIYLKSINRYFNMKCVCLVQ